MILLTPTLIVPGTTGADHFLHHLDAVDLAADVRVSFLTMPGVDAVAVGAITVEVSKEYFVLSYHPCPARARRLLDLTTCRNSATFLGLTWHGVETDALWPKGCYAAKGNVFFNAHATGRDAAGEIVCAMDSQQLYEYGAIKVKLKT